jgi:hypothetical protein
MTAIDLWTGAAIAQQPFAGGADLFAPSSTVGKAIDAQRALPVTPFYEIARVTMPAEPATLVRAEPAVDFALPPGVTATRILYHTRTASNKDALASGVVLVPYSQPPKEGWPLLAWSHGTSGIGRNCAPSLMKSLFYNWEGLYEYVTLGYEVVATDYVGVGTEGRQAYLDMLSNGGDVINAVPAAHAAVTNLSKKWLVIGHSQGGLSSLGVAQLEGEIKDPKFLGTVALAGASDLGDGVHAVESAKPVLNGLLAFGVYGAKTIYPELVGGGDDILFTESSGSKIFQRLCSSGGRVQRNVYPGLGHDPVVYGSLRDQLNWIAARFTGKRAPCNCPSD